MDGQPIGGQDSGLLLIAGYSLFSLKYPKTGLTEIEKRRVEMTGRIPQARFEIPEVEVEGDGIYYACVQVTNGAQVTNGHRVMFFIGDADPKLKLRDAADAAP